MSPGRGRAPVVVAIDDAGSADDAVDWASAEAATRGCPLRVVHAVNPPLPADPYGVIPPLDSLLTARMRAESILREAVARARSVASDLEVSARLRLGTPARAVLDEAAGARLLVLGNRGPRGLLARSVSIQIAAHACCPVVVIRPPQGAGDPGWSPPRVVVGVDAASSCTPAVGFAFQAARQRGVPLAAVHAWTPDRPADLEAISGPPAMAEVLAGRILERALDRWRSEFAGVPVVTTLVRGDPAHALVAESRGAALLVVGSRGRGHVLAAMLGSVSRSVLRHGHSPLAIIRHDSALTAQPPAGRVADSVPERDQVSDHDKGPRRRSTSRNRRWPA
ncbi:universal stress protein (plasmid) [Pseudonocardia bannensis]|uniref:Universal stress protein n=1 Tax=Pseudonocardia bannensis TaxID=630973 RepID=A0A848DR51_9PSEU|nr:MULTISPECIES: universal stress protein [Pseudonocardia]NMH94979.1 universal stress protein [Pseudonocardia bannensis]